MKNLKHILKCGNRLICFIFFLSVITTPPNKTFLPIIDSHSPCEQLLFIIYL